MEKPLHFVFRRFRQIWTKIFRAKFEAKTLDKPPKESVCIPGRNIRNRLYFSISFRSLFYYNTLYKREKEHERKQLLYPCQQKRKIQAKNWWKSQTRKKERKRWKKNLPKAGGCGIILKRQGPPERMTSGKRRKRKGRTNVRTLKSEIASSQRPKSFWKKCLTKNHNCDKIIKSPVERRRAHRTLKIEQYRKTCNGTYYRVGKHVKQFQTK